MTNPSLFLLFLAAAGIGGYLLATLSNTSGRKNTLESRQQYPGYYPGLTPGIPANEKKSKSGLTILPFIFILFICSMLYVLYNFNHKLNNLKETQTTHTIEANGKKARSFSVASKEEGQPTGRYHAVSFNGGWGIELINEESSLRWLEEYERALAPFFTRDRTLMVKTTINDSDIIDLRFYLGPFDTREDAINIKDRLKYLSPEAKIVPLKDLDNLQAFQVQAPGA